MGCVYIITNTVNGKLYAGVTKTELKSRWSAHKWTAKKDPRHLYCSMRKYGNDAFTIESVIEHDDPEFLGLCESELIEKLRRDGKTLYNVLSGDYRNFTGYVPTEEAIQKLKESRVGRTPALGMQHSEENKKLFSELSNAYWSTQYKYLDDMPNPWTMAWAEANQKWGISKTHFYRLRKLFDKPPDEDIPRNRCKGSAHHEAKVNEELVSEMRLSNESNSWWRERTGLSMPTIHGIRVGRSWKHVDTPPKPRPGKGHPM